MLDKRSKFVILLVTLLVVVSIFLTYRRAFIVKNYDIVTETEEESIQ